MSSSNHNEQAHSHEHDHGSQFPPGEEMIAHAHHPSYGINILVWIGLLSLTAITVAVAGIDLGTLALTVALIIALVKTMFVVNFFMHVKFDSKLVKIFIGVCMLIFIVVLVLTFFDLTFRF